MHVLVYIADSVPNSINFLLDTYAVYYIMNHEMDIFQGGMNKKHR